MQKLYTNIQKISDRAVVYANEGKVEDVVQLANAVHVMSTAFIQLKEVEIHERFHMNEPGPDFTLPGEVEIGSN